MGVSITAKNSTYDFDMGYGGFFNLRKNIALSLNKEFGENYAELSKCIIPRQFEENDRTAELIIENHHLDVEYKDVLDFLYMPDTNGKINYKTCKKIYDLIKNVNFDGMHFCYQFCAKDDYEHFKEFLKECYSKRKNMIWY